MTAPGAQAKPCARCGAQPVHHPWQAGDTGCTVYQVATGRADQWLRDVRPELRPDVMQTDPDLYAAFLLQASIDSAQTPVEEAVADAVRLLVKYAPEVLR